MTDVRYPEPNVAGFVPLPSDATDVPDALWWALGRAVMLRDFVIARKIIDWMEQQTTN